MTSLRSTPISVRLLGAVLSILALLTSLHVSAQDVDPCSGGTLYYVAFPGVAANGQDTRFASKFPENYYLYIYSPVDQVIQVSDSRDSTIRLNLRAGEMLEFDTKRLGSPIISTANSPQKKPLKVQAEAPIVLYAYMVTHFGCAAFTPIPVESWGRQYYGATWEGETVRTILPTGESIVVTTTIVEAPAQVLILAAYDGTEVRIKPTDSLASCAECRQVVLNAGEAYLVQSYVDTAAGAKSQADIAGTSITANKQIGVISGNTRLWHEPFAEGYLAGNTFKDMAVEWMTPVEQHGTDFVFLPTWDTVNPADRYDTGAIRTAEYLRIYSTTSAETSFRRDGQDITPSGGATVDGAYLHQKIDSAKRAIHFTTTEPAMAFQSPRPVTMFGGTTGSGSFIGARYVAWGTYMVEMTPREQWVFAAPFIAPSYPVRMEHHVNVVASSADQANIYYRVANGTAQRFVFNQGTLPGTDIVWGEMALDTGVTYFLEGRNGARFGGFVYGSRKGYELNRPGGAKKDESEKDRTTLGLHPSEYEEEIAMMYGYPLAPSRCLVGQDGTFDVKKESGGCGKVTITLSATGTEKFGLRFLRIIESSNVNTRLELVEPKSMGDLLSNSFTTVKFSLLPIDPSQDAEGVVGYKDRSSGGGVGQIEYAYTAGRPEVNPSFLNFDYVKVGSSAGEQVITITNPLPDAMTIRGLGFALGDQDFTITRTEPAFNWGSSNDSLVLKQGESLKVWIDMTPTNENQNYSDSLMVMLNCFTLRFPLTGSTIAPCLTVGDLDFGIVKTGEEKRLDLEICNVGGGNIHFRDSTGSGLITWLLKEFDVSPEDIEIMRATVLGPGECLTISVSFTSASPGAFRTTARFWANTRNCRDTSIWKANVLPPGTHVARADWGERWVSSDNSCTKNTVRQYQEEVAAFNSGDQPSLVIRAQIVSNPDNVFTILNLGNVTPNKQLLPGASEKIIVGFRPLETKAYSGLLRLYFRDASGTVDSSDAVLEGVGIESCLQINDLTIIADSTVTPPKGTRRLLLRSVGERAVTVTSISLSGIDAPDFVYEGGFPALPIVIPPGESYPLSLTFLPSTRPAGERRAELVVEGDYAYVDCPGSCSDSLAELTGKLGTLTVAGEEALAGYAINQVMPNPFSDELEISFSLGKAGETSVALYNAAGMLVEELLREELSSGLHTLRWSEKIPSGLYYLQITSGNWSESRRVWSVK
ncbi:MAG: T9SS type A sorting domain-containing protein [Candidatus Kapaibacterium sp.]